MSFGMKLMQMSSDWVVRDIQNDFKFLTVLSLLLIENCILRMEIMRNWYRNFILTKFFNTYRPINNELKIATYTQAPRVWVCVCFVTTTYEFYMMVNGKERKGDKHTTHTQHTFYTIMRSARLHRQRKVIFKHQNKFYAFSYCFGNRHLVYLYTERVFFLLK